MGAMGAQAGFPLETWFWEMPLCTRWWTTATVLTSALVQCQIVTPFQLFYSFRAVFYKNQVFTPCSELSVPLQGPRSPHYKKQRLIRETVLAPPNHIPLLRPPLPRPRLPRLLPNTLLPPPRRILRPLPSTLLLAPPVRHHLPNRALPPCLYAVPRTPPLQHAGLHLVTTES
jgi:Derlin-2/3